MTYVKHQTTGIIINNDTAAYDSMRAQRARGKQILQMQRDIDALKETVRLLQEKIGKDFD